MAKKLYIINIKLVTNFYFYKLQDKSYNALVSLMILNFYFSHLTLTFRICSVNTLKQTIQYVVTC